jgi:hypothetical protein
MYGLSEAIPLTFTAAFSRERELTFVDCNNFLLGVINLYNVLIM